MSYVETNTQGTSAGRSWEDPPCPGFESTSAFRETASPGLEVYLLPVAKTPLHVDWFQDPEKHQRPTSALHDLRGETSPEQVAKKHANDQLPRETTRAAIHELRRLSGLTWDQLARLFGVDRRSLHHWGSGQPLSRKNEERLHRLLAVIRYIDRGAADLNRQALMQPTDDGDLPFDLLVQEEYQAVKDILDRGPGRRDIQRKPLSPEEQALHRPAFKPVELLDARHDPVHVKMKGSRVPRVARIRKKR